MATAALANLQKTLSQAHQQNEDNDESMDEKEDNQEDEEVTMLQFRPSIREAKQFISLPNGPVSRFGIAVIFPSRGPI
jgi:hypothetical protein